MGDSFKRRALALLSVLSLLSACTNDGNSLAGDANFGSKCPPGGCASQEPNQNDLMLYRPSTTIYQKSIQGDMVEISGDCYASTYPQNYLSLSVNYNGSPIQMLAENRKSVRSADTALTCYQGRFNFVINGDAMLGVGNYTAQIEIVGVDAQGVEHRNAGSGLLRVSIVRTPAN
ncbi:MAG: hypothetical protein KF802_00990 [Bdellovibrionaceae bacterium]|nr:hypothetical protein [Pseudobdellovibrionaceae bacterium]MBX3034295.1 hypothetical protein [Pseudobdellovibrionaceae bacterium]